MVPVHFRNLGMPRNNPEYRQGMFRTRISQSGHQHEWQDTEGSHTHTAIHIETQKEPKTRGLEGYGSSSSAP
ncbi:hypothetical protein O181_021618 [Austropuccinia psidii MF-1]|uniref:Uncharacterized protein n=1 Tax=Austropuccinia psidii MF-1 TaxID=1389203 RepID=A0A9Q3CF88_9BASI|nr:hypothetical protein [Austropuccinia psidii MF-1]